MSDIDILVFLQGYALTMSDIDILGKLGSGVTGEVFTVKHKPTGKIMAAKVC